MPLLLYKMSEKLKYYLSGYPDELINKWKIDTEGLYSITPRKDNEYYLKEIKKLIKVKNTNVLDICASVGGDSLALLIEFKNVDSNEFDKTRYKYLKSNLKNASKFYEFNSRTFNKDANKFFDKTSNTLSKLPRDHYTLIYMDPPWGGVDYKNQKDLQMFFGETNVIDYINNTLIDKADYIAIKAPSNWLESNIKKLHGVRLIKVFKIPISKKKGTYYNVFLLKVKK